MAREVALTAKFMVELDAVKGQLVRARGEHEGEKARNEGHVRKLAIQAVIFVLLVLVCHHTRTASLTKSEAALRNQIGAQNFTVRIPGDAYGVRAYPRIVRRPDKRMAGETMGT